MYLIVILVEGTDSWFSSQLNLGIFASGNKSIQYRIDSDISNISESNESKCQMRMSNAGAASAFLGMRSTQSRFCDRVRGDLIYKI